MIILGLILWSIFGIWGSYLMIREIFGVESDEYTPKLSFTPDQIGGLIFLPMGGIVTLFLAYLIISDIICVKKGKEDE